MPKSLPFLPPRFREVADLKAEVRKRWHGWIDSVEPSLGSGTGQPDLLVLMKQRGIMHMLPIELKVGTVKGGRVFPDLVRGSQVRWHFHLNDKGGKSALIVGMSKDEAYLIDGRDVIEWKIGYKINEKASRIFFECETDIFLSEMVETFFRNRMKPNPYSIKDEGE